MTVSVACLFGGPVITVTFQRSLRAALAGKKSGRIYIRFTQITTFSHALAGLCCSLELCMQRSPDRQNSRRAHALPLAYMYSCTAMVVLAEFQSALRAQLGHRSPLFFSVPCRWDNALRCESGPWEATFKVILKIVRVNFNEK